MGRKRASIIIDRAAYDDYALDKVTLALKTTSIYQGYIDGVHEFAIVQQSGYVKRQPREIELWAHTIKSAKNLQPLIFETPKDSKWCSNCGDWVNKRGFSPDRRNRDGLHVWCKTCRNEHERRMYWARKAA